MSDYGVPARPSQTRIFGKSIYVFAAGWVISVGWLWIAGLRQHLLRHGAAPPDYGGPFLVLAIVPALLIALCGRLVTRWTGRAPEPDVERREWWYAFWWAAVPNWLLLTTIWVMIGEAR